MFWMCPNVGFFSAQTGISSWNCWRESWDPTGISMFQTFNGCDNFRQSASLRGNPSCRNSEGNEMCSVYICVLNENWKISPGETMEQELDSSCVIAVVFLGVTDATRQSIPEAPTSFQFDVGCCWAHGGWKLHWMKVQVDVFFCGKLSCF